jgi:hypothetical protein
MSGMRPGMPGFGGVSPIEDGSRRSELTPEFNARTAIRTSKRNVPV